VKDARAEAAKEIEAYKLQKARDFAKFEAEVLPFVVTFS
jgi:Vacuolar (H+)-ATPase G subunit